MKNYNTPSESSQEKIQHLMETIKQLPHEKQIAIIREALELLTKAEREAENGKTPTSKE